jgi:hypothetical protein
MRVAKYICFFVACIMMAGYMVGQTKEACLAEVIALDKKMDMHSDTAMRTKNISLSYSVRITDWEDEVTVSNVKIHKQKGFVHFSTEQAFIYQDEKEVVIIMPIQRIAIINSMTKQLANSRIGDDFYEMRRGIIDSCKVLKCETIGSKKTVELKVNRSSSTTHNMVGMTYVYDVGLEKIYSVKLTYNQDYKIKDMQVNYKDLDVNGTHTYNSARTYLLDRGGKLLSKYSGYEFIDNRDSGKKNKK